MCFSYTDEPVVSTSARPAPRYLHAAHGDKQDFLAAFGAGADGRFLNDRWSYNFEARDWRLEAGPNTTGALQPRALAPGIAFRFQFFTFGGAVITEVPATNGSAACVPTRWIVCKFYF
jgi:hypothetical protein